MQALQEPLACGAYAPSRLLGGAVGDPLSSNGPPPASSPNLMDADVPALVPLLYVGVNEERSESALDNEAVSVISVSLLSKLKERESLRVEQIGMVPQGVGYDHVTAKHQDSTGTTNRNPNPNPKQAHAETDELETSEHLQQAVKAEGQCMTAWRGERSSSSALVRLPPSDAPTQQQPQNGAEMARRALVNTMSGQVLVATPKDKSSAYIVPAYYIDSDPSVTYEFIRTSDAVLHGLMDYPSLSSDPRSTRAGKRNAASMDDDTVAPQQATGTFEQMVAAGLGITGPDNQAEPSKLNVEFTMEMIDEEGDSKTVKAMKKAMRKEVRDDVELFNNDVDFRIQMRRLNEEAMKMSFDRDWRDHIRRKGARPPLDAVIYWVIYYPFLKDSLKQPPYSYSFEDSKILSVIKGATEWKCAFSDRLDPEDSIKSILASALLKINSIEERWKATGIEKEDISEDDRAIMETLKSIIEAYTKGQEQLFGMMKGSSRTYVRGFLQTDEAKQTIKGLDNAPQFEILKRLNDTLAMGTAGTSQASATKHIVMVYDNKIGTKNPYIEQLNALCQKYYEQGVASTEKNNIKEDYDQAYEKYKEFDDRVQDAQSELRLAVAESSTVSKECRRRALEISKLVETKRDELEKLEKEEVDGRQEQDGIRLELTRLGHGWELTPAHVKMEFCPPHATIPDCDASTYRQRRQEHLEGRLQFNRERGRLITELRLEIQAAYQQIMQYVCLAKSSEQEKKTANAKRRYQRETRAQLTESQKERRKQTATKRTRERSDLVKETGGGRGEMAVAMVDKSARNSRAKMDSDVILAEELLPRLDSAKVEFEKEKSAKRKECKDQNTADEKKRSELLTKIDNAKNLGKGAKAAIVQKVLDAAAGNATLNDKYKERKKATDALQREVESLVQQIGDCVTITVTKAKELEILKPIKQLTDEYNVLLAGNQGKHSKGSSMIAAQLKEKNNSVAIVKGDRTLMTPEGIAQILNQYRKLEGEFEAVKTNCIELKKRYDTHTKNIDDMNLEFTLFTGNTLDRFFQESLSSNGAPCDPPNQEQKDQAAEVVELMVAAQELKLRIDERERVFKEEYNIKKNAEDLKKSSSIVAQRYGECYAELRRVRGRIRTALENPMVIKDMDRRYIDKVLSIYKKTNEGKEDSMSDIVKVTSDAFVVTGQTPTVKTSIQNLALRVTASRRVKVGTADQVVSTKVQKMNADLKDAMRGDGVTERLEKNMRLAEYQDAVDDIVRFAKAGSGRALHYYNLICTYATRLSSVKENGTNDSSPLAIADGMADCKSPPSKESNLTIHWENVEKYTPLAYEKNFAAELIYVIVQWTRLPMERRAGSMPSKAELEKWINGRVISNGADFSPPQIDQLTGELMVVTTEDKFYNKARGIRYSTASREYEFSRGAGGDQISDPLGSIKRTPVSWVTIDRGLSLGVHVPITDEFSICRALPSQSSPVTRWPLHLTKFEAVFEHKIHDKGRDTGKEERALAAYETAQKWEIGHQRHFNYPEFDPSDFSPAFWTAVETSRDTHTRLVGDYKTFVDRISQLNQQMEALNDTVRKSEGSFMWTKTVASIAEQADIPVEDSVRTADERMMNLSTMQGTTSAILEVYLTLKVCEQARDRLGYRMAADFGIPRTGYTNLSGNTMQVFQDMLNKRTKRQSFVEESSVLDRVPEFPNNGTALDGINATAEEKMWLQNNEMTKRAVMLFNQFLQLYYPWETPLSADDEARILRFLEWMRKLRSHCFTHVVLLMVSETDMRMWVRGVDGGGASQRVLGPGFTSSTLGFQEDSAESRKNQSRWYTYAAHWYANAASRVEDFETPVINLEDYREEENTGVGFYNRLRALIKESTNDAERKEIMKPAKQQKTSQGPHHKAEAELQIQNIKGAMPRSPDDETRRTMYDAVNEQRREHATATLADGTLCSNPWINVTIEGDGGEEQKELNVKLLDIEPRHMTAVIKSLRRAFPGKYSTCLRYVAVNGEKKVVGSIVEHGVQTTDGIVPNTLKNLTNDSRAYGETAFVTWLRSELEGEKQLTALAHDRQHKEQPLTVYEGSDSGSDSGSDYGSGAMDTTEALAGEDESVEELLRYIVAMRNTRVPELGSVTLECTLRMYDPGLLRSPMAACGRPIRPMPLPDFELEA